MMNMTEYIRQYQTPIGTLTAISEGTAITDLSFDTPKKLSYINKNIIPNSDLPVFAELENWLKTYFAGEDPGRQPLIKAAGTPFQQSVWQIVAGVPYSTLITYGEIARRLARERGIPKMSAQAVGNAMGHNPISLLIPCHRVINSDGSLGGYGSCPDRKIRLLEYEGIIRSWNTPK